MKKLIISLPFVLPLLLSAQVDSSLEVPPPPPPEDMVFKGKRTVIVEKMPEFPGGEDSMNKFIADNLQYPDSAKKNGIEGVVYISLSVEKDGSFTEIEVASPLFDEACGVEALRILKLMPAWSPGVYKGKAVRTKWVVPITFKLK